MPDNTRLILGNGEQYISHTPNSSGGGAPKFPRSFEEARTRLQADLTKAIKEFERLPNADRMKDEATFCIRMNPSFVAKSYDPRLIMQQVSGLSNVGSRNFRQKISEVPESAKTKKEVDRGKTEISSRLVFVQGKDEAFRSFISRLDLAETAHTTSFKQQIQGIERIDFLSEKEKIESFFENQAWKQGRVELVLHPTHYGTGDQMEFLHTLFSEFDQDFEKVRSKAYENGPTFVSCNLTKDLLLRLAQTNPLRSAQPMQCSELQDLRSSPSFPMPLAPLPNTPSTIKVGIFDGGIDINHPHLVGHAEEDTALSIQTTSLDVGIAHGTAVAGAILHGALNDHDANQTLPTPPVSVVSFRILPTSDPNDTDLYESIDVIENVVPQRKDIKFYNVSLGPRGPIQDDSISRFTFALDRLAHTHNVGFCVAVGNDGNAGSTYGRIQTPSDMVNGLGVGAYSQATGDKKIASYSCVGPGREAAKAKPDLVAFGGCSQRPFHLLSTNPNSKTLSTGTSFSTPLVTSLAAQATGLVETGNPLFTRTLLIHTAKHERNSFDNQMGHGYSAPNIDALLSCANNEVTILYEGTVATKTSVRLPFFLPNNLLTNGKVEMVWTIGILPETDASQVSDYTDVCIEDTFHPHSERFHINPPKGLGNIKRKKVHLSDDAGEIATLQSQGWKLSALPNSESGNVYKTEDQRRLDFKWEPIVRRRRSKTISTVQEPFIVLHATPRGDKDETVRFTALVTLRATEDVDIYSQILLENQALQPVRLRSEAEIRV